MRLNFTCFGLVLLMTTLSSVAQWSMDPSINTPICTASGNQIDLRLDRDGRGGAFIVWKDYRNGLPDIYVQRVDKDGYPQWANNGVAACANSSDQSTPSIARDTTGGIIVAWSDWRSGIERDLYAQRIDSNGNVMWTTDGVVVTNKQEREHSQKMIEDGAGGTIIAWEEQKSWSMWIVRAQRLDQNGNVLWTSGGVKVCLTDKYRINVRLQSDKRGGAILTWQEYSSVTDYDVYAQRLDPNGVRLWGDEGVAVCTANNVQNNVKIDPDSTTKGAYICWIDNRNGVDYDIYAQKLDSNGTVLWQANGVPVVTATGNQSAEDIQSNANVDGVYVVWKDARSGNTDLNIYGQRIGSNGVPAWATNGVLICSAPNDQFNPNIVGDNGSGAIIVWQDNRAGLSDVYAQKIDNNGNAVWAVDGVPVGIAGGVQNSPKNINDGAGGSIFFWEDKRNGTDYNIYAHHLFATGSASGIADQNDSYTESSVFPNPSNGDCVIRVSSINENGNNSSAGKNIQLEVSDILGRKLITRTLSPVFGPGGQFDYHLDCVDLANGIYHYKVSFVDGYGFSIGEIIISK